MTTFVVLATGQSLSHEQVSQVRDAHVESGCKAIAVSNAYLLAPWADAMVSNDVKWWKQHPQALQFAGRKFCGGDLKGTERLKPESMFPAGSNSGLQGMRVSLMLGASRIILLGMDMHGTHYFGKHPAALKNSTPADFHRMLRQFQRWKSDVEVVNCSPGSALTCFKTASLADVL
jgi:hypothetical protein